jgi:hypothetical protein
VREAGRINLVGLLLLGALAAGVWAAVLLVPLYVDHLDVKEAVTVVHNLAGRVHNDGVLRAELRERTRGLASHLEPDDFGVLRSVPGLGLTDEQIVIERNPVTGSVLVEVRYEREVRLRPTRRTHTLSFRAQREGIPPP